MRTAIRCSVLAAVFAIQTVATPYPGTMGVNLGDVPFVDMVKNTSGYTNSSGGAMSGSDYDAQGWPARDFRLLLLDSRPVAEWSGTIDDPEAYRRDYGGLYKGSFTGQATVSVMYTHGTVSNVQYNAGTNTTTFDLTLPAPSGSNYCFTVMSFINTRRSSGGATNSGITNLRIIRPGYGTDPTQLFTDEFISTLTHASFSTIRAMGLTNTAMMPVVYPARTVWSNRKQLNDASWRPHAGKLDGAPWEVYIDLCNQVNMDMWANIPMSADTMYVRNLAVLIRDRLNSNLNVYIEMDNEVWGYDAPKNYNAAEADAKGLAHPLMNLAQRITFAARTFESVFGAGSLTNRVRPVMAWWIAMRMDVTNMLNYINANYGTPSDIVYAISPAMYYSIGGAMEEEAAASQHRMVMKMFSDIRSQIATRTQWMNVATTWNLKGGVNCYEGGPHTPSANHATAPNLAAKITMHRTEHMPAQMLYNMREAFVDLGGQLFMNFTLSSSYNRYGCWGITDDVHNPNRNTKFRAVRELGGDVATPYPPSNFWAQKLDASSISLSWTNNATNQSGFIIERRDSTTGVLLGSPDTVAAGALDRQHTGLSSTNNLYYTIRAYNATGPSTYVLALPSTQPPVSVQPRRCASLVPMAPVTDMSATRVLVYSLCGKRLMDIEPRALAYTKQSLPSGTHIIELRGPGGSTRSIFTRATR